MATQAVAADQAHDSAGSKCKQAKGCIKKLFGKFWIFKREPKCHAAKRKRQ